MERRFVILCILIGILLAALTVFFIYPSNKAHGPITCTSDEQCGGAIVSEKFCKDGDVYGNGQVNRCVKAGTEESVCETSYGTVLVEDCKDGCENSKCS